MTGWDFFFVIAIFFFAAYESLFAVAFGLIYIAYKIGTREVKNGRGKERRAR